MKTSTIRRGKCQIFRSLPTRSAEIFTNSATWAIAFFLAAPAFAQLKQHKTSDAPFLKPQEAVAKMEISDKFQIDIFAAEPDIGEPIAFTFDDRGRVWVVENYNYVDRRSHTDEKPLTRIQIFEDTNSDGVFDTKKLFTDKLTFSSGIATGFGGVFVGTPPNLLFIPDADGDDKPDGEPQVLLNGWGIHDRHETLNSFIWGPDGWLYGCHGVFTSSMVGKPGASDKDRLFIDGGIWRYHPTKNEFEVFARGLSNPWGFDFNDVGQGFATCCVIPHLFHIVQGGHYHKQSKAHLNPYVYDYITTIRDHTHLSAHGGARFYLADTFPKEYRDQLFMCNIHQHQVLTDIMKPSGSGFIGTHGEDFMTTNDLAWVGFSIEVGPDGGVYILDWHDTDICGNKINFPNSGRIYRLMPKGVEPIKRPNIGALSDAMLVAMQDHPNDWYVRAARLNLQMRATAGNLDPEAGIWLREILETSDTSPKRLRAFWAMHVTGNLSESDLLEFLNHEDEYVRAFAIQFFCEDKKAPTTALSRFAELAKTDPSPVVRLYLAAALQRIEHDQRWTILANLAQHSEDSEDHNIPRMLWYALEPMVPLHPEKSLELAVNGKLPNLQEHVARRLVSGDLPPASHRNHQKAGVAPKDAQKVLQRVAPGFQVRDVGEGGVKPQPEFRNEFAVQTHPLSRKMPCVLYRHLDLPKGQTSKLRIRASYHPHGNWQLRVLANKEVIHDQIVSYETVKSEWLDLEIDLTKFTGKHLDLEIENRANDWAWEFGFWGKVEVVSTAATPAPAKVSSTAKKQPNIVFFLVDDLGWSDVGCFGSQFYETPNIDQLAAEGVKFTNGYAACHVCSPTRASILTGKYPARNNLTEWLNGRPEKPFQVLLNAEKAMSLDPEEVTLAEALKASGYATALFGKWHLGRNTNPTEHGFDVHAPHSVNSNLGKRGFLNPKKIPGLDEGDYVTDRLAELAANYIAENKDRPFLLYMSHFSVHDPIQGRPDLVEKYKKKLAGMQPQPGPDYILEGNPDSPTYPSRSELDELLKLPEYADTYTTYPNDLVKVKQKQDNVKLAGMVESVDQSLGTLIAELKEHGLEDNTIVIFMSDNGGMSVMNGTPHNNVPKQRLNGATSSSNLPLRGAKGWLYEGGIRVPLIVKWPHQGKTGTVCDEPIISTDFFPTILEMVGVENKAKDIDGKSFTRLVRGEEMDRGPIYWHFPHYSNHGMQSPGGAIRDGDFKLLEYFENGTVQLFNLKEDIGEQHDLSETNTAKTEELRKKLHQWRKEVDAKMMVPNPNYDPATDLWSGAG